MGRVLEKQSLGEAKKQYSKSKGGFLTNMQIIHENEYEEIMKKYRNAISSVSQKGTLCTGCGLSVS